MQAGESPSRRRRGITVAETLVVVAVVAVLGAAMMPTYMEGVYRARRSEALYALKAIHDAQSFHFVKNRVYTDSFDDLVFDLDGGELRSDGVYEGPHYTYTLDTWALGGRPAANYRATATGNIDASDSVLDIVIIENALTVKNE